MFTWTFDNIGFASSNYVYETEQYQSNITFPNEPGRIPSRLQSFCLWYPGRNIEKGATSETNWYCILWRSDNCSTQQQHSHNSGGYCESVSLDGSISFQLTRFIEIYVDIVQLSLTLTNVGPKRQNKKKYRKKPTHRVPLPFLSQLTEFYWITVQHTLPTYL